MRSGRSLFHWVILHRVMQSDNLQHAVCYYTVFFSASGLGVVLEQVSLCTLAIKLVILL